MHVGDNIECCKNGDSSSSQSDSITPQSKQQIKFFFSCNREPFLYQCAILLQLINTLMLKVLTCIEKANFAEAFGLMFTGDRRCDKRVDSLFPCIEFRIKRRIPIDAVVPPHYVLINSVTRS